MNEGRTRRPIYHFGNLILDLERGALLSASGSEVSLRPKAFALLHLFVENAGRLVDRGMIIEALWPRTAVTDESVAQCIKDVRRALGDEAQHLLKTVRGRGYRLEASVVCKERGPQKPSAAADLQAVSKGDADEPPGQWEQRHWPPTGRPGGSRAATDDSNVLWPRGGGRSDFTARSRGSPPSHRRLSSRCGQPGSPSMAGKSPNIRGDSVFAGFGWPIANGGRSRAGDTGGAVRGEGG